MLSNIFVVIIVIIWGAYGIEKFFKNTNRLDNRDISFLKWLYVFHMLMALFYGYYITKAGGDAKAYWFLGDRFSVIRTWGEFYKTGTFFILFLTFPLVKYLGMSFYIGNILFALVGFSGFIYFYCIVRKFINKPIVLLGIGVFPLILYLPNMHFWSAGIGKDSLTLFAIMLFFYALFDYKKKWLLLVFALILAYHIRPHIALFLTISSFLAVLIDRRMKLSIKIILAILMLAGGAVMFNSVLAFIKLDEVSSESISQFSETRTTNLSKSAGSSVDLSGYPLPLKVLTFLYRPLFFDINGVLAVVSSFENLIILCLTGIMLKLKPIASFRVAPMPIKSIVIFFVISSIAFSMILSNLGIMLRQKNPIIFCLLIFVFWCFAYDRYRRSKRKALMEKSNF